MSTLATTPDTDREFRIFRDEYEIREVPAKETVKIYNCSGTYNADGKEETDFLWLSAAGIKFIGFDSGTDGLWGGEGKVYYDAECTEEFDPAQSSDSCEIHTYWDGNNWKFLLLKADILETEFEEFTEEEYALWDTLAEKARKTGSHYDMILFLAVAQNRAFVKFYHHTATPDYYQEIEAWDTLGPEIAAKGEDYEQLVLNYLAEQAEA